MLLVLLGVSLEVGCLVGANGALWLAPKLIAKTAPVSMQVDAVTWIPGIIQVREFQLRVRVRFRLRTPDDRELLPPTELLAQQDQSYDESLALAKEAEAQLLYRTMQSDIVQQILRRLAAVRQI